MEPERPSLFENWKEKFKKYAVPALAVVGGIALLVMFSGQLRYTIIDMGESMMYGGNSYSKSQSYGVAAMPSMPNVGGTGGYARNLAAQDMDMAYDDYAMEEMEMASYDGGGFAPSIMPAPEPSPYVPDLEKYETTDYSVYARTKDFDDACSLLTDLKARDDVDFRNFSEQLNYCSATFYTEEDNVDEVTERFSEIDGVEMSRDTVSVTRQRSNIQTRTGVLMEQLASVENTLTMAETQYAELTEIARAEGDASALTRAIRDKLSTIETLNQRRISLVSQIQQLDQQAADLNERIGVVAFNVSFSRAYPIYPDEDSRKWENAWEELSDSFTYFLIGFTVYLGIFILKVVQYAFYGLILLLLVRFGWKVVRRVWRI